MRIYRNFREASSEITRDLKEMGIRVHSVSYQNKNIEGDERFDSLELQNYVYTVTEPRVQDIDATQPWADAEFAERVDPRAINPGEAWKHRSDVWTEFLNEDGEFDYTYNERIRTYLGNLINTLEDDRGTRQAYLSVWRAHDIRGTGGVVRIPCTLGYYFQYRQGKLNITYLQRSADLATHFQNDLFMSHSLQAYVADQLNMEIGTFTHWLGSLHVFQKDVEDVF